ncbi:hypothetical protein TSARBOMBA_164 [Bacillus phage TsarBomba]|uniref:Uncharacterized protein n=1 Tax=Bacillus phage TsarBomba TaxID=1690456 RepID=A0A0K2D0F1_9CAUD|nr:hypothetical protein TSARBOMBA_164 [Bacillus phage TsarBomba]ALA13198.1 hypothetical protein TSARBOMBA_164 [Bacillus phage TsarBomba]
MWIPFRRRHCKQCGETLKMFHNVEFCDLACCVMYRAIEKQQKERKAANESSK